jgi:hypothetical protein
MVTISSCEEKNQPLEFTAILAGHVKDEKIGLRYNVCCL